MSIISFLCLINFLGVHTNQGSFLRPLLCTYVYSFRSMYINAGLLFPIANLFFYTALCTYNELNSYNAALHKFSFSRVILYREQKMRSKIHLIEFREKYQLWRKLVLNKFIYVIKLSLEY